jgi:hypothetical protein
LGKRKKIQRSPRSRSIFVIATKFLNLSPLQFNLYLEELESARKPLDRWRMERGVGLPLVLEVISNLFILKITAAALIENSKKINSCFSFFFADLFASIEF